MAIESLNRFALLDAKDGQSSSESDTPTPQRNGNDSQVRKPRTGQPKTLIIRDVNRHTTGNRLAVKPISHTDSHGSPRLDARNIPALRNGVDTSYNPNENWCGVCQFKLPTKALLLSHIKQTPKHENYCNLCKRVFKDRNGLQNHVDNCLDHDVFCNLCLSAFKDKWGLRNHFENNYAVRHEFACLTCLMGFKSRHEMELHLRTAKKHVRCDTCHRNFRNQDERDEHWTKTTKHKHCLQPGCDFDAPNRNILDKHLEEDHFQCEGCYMIFASQTKLTAHIDICAFSLTCDSCHGVVPNQAYQAAHRGNCFACVECNYFTSHKGNYQIHMTKHTSATLACWACDVPMRTQSSLINHLESGACLKFPDPVVLTRTLGEWWYSPLYMDLDIHAQIRRKTIDLQVLQGLISEGAIHPFICRASGCMKTFAHFSSLVLHVESQACEWDTEKLGLQWLKKELM